jgi:hydroxyacylglutathione hydrolase
MTPIEIHTVETPGLGDRSYLATDGTVAVVVDPQRDIGRFLTLAAHLGVRITHVLETHVHNDYVSGGLALARVTGASCVVAAGEDLAFDHVGVHHGDELVAGGLTIRVVAAPGHTHHHVAYVLAGSDSGEVAGTFTGGSLLFGTVGRTDLAGPEHTDRLTRAQWLSVRRLAGAAPDGAAVWPTHGFGSFCSGGAGSGATESTIGAERAANPALLQEEGPFVAGFVAGLGPYPAYYRHMGPLNRAGAAPLPPPPPATGIDDLSRRLAAGEWVVDLRPRKAFASGHLAGSLNVEGGASVATYVGWVVPWGEPISLVGPDEASVAEAQIALARIGIEPVALHVAGNEWPRQGVATARYGVRTFADLAAALSGGRVLTVLDVRGEDEWRDGHLPGALHIPWHDLRARMGEVPARRPVWVHCAAGFRAAIAASLLHRARRTPVLVDDRWFSAFDVGLAVDQAA